MTRISVAEIVIDHGLYPRTRIDPAYVDELADALRAGAELPPIIVDRDTRRLVDGFHRLTAIRRVTKAQIVDCDLVRCTSDAELYLESLRRNAGHGRRFTDDDITLIRKTVSGLKLELTQVVGALTMTKERLAGLPLRALAPVRSPAARGSSRPAPNRRAPVQSSSGTTGATPRAQAPSPSVRAHVEALIAALERGKYPKDDDGFLLNLGYLADLIEPIVSRSSSTSGGRQ